MVVMAEMVVVSGKIGFGYGEIVCQATGRCFRERALSPKHLARHAARLKQGSSRRAAFDPVYELVPWSTQSHRCYTITPT